MMPENTCSKCGQPIQGDACAKCGAASDGAIREGEPPVLPKEQEPWPYKHEPGPGSGLDLGCVASVVVILGLTAICLLIAPIKMVRDVAARTQMINNMKQTALGWHHHHDVTKHFPTPRMTSVNNDKVLPVDLSWRVAILPYIEAGDLFNGFDLTAGWEHPHNLPIHNQMPATYIRVYVDRENIEPKMLTHFQCFTGPGTLYPNNAPKKFQDLVDGSSNTFLVAEAEKGVIWTRPADMAIRPDQPLPFPIGLFYAAMGDGTVRWVSRDRTDDTILRQMINPNDGKPAADWDN
jgi:hypothetical protein